MNRGSLASVVGLMLLTSCGAAAPSTPLPAPGPSAVPTDSCRARPVAEADLLDDRSPAEAVTAYLDDGGSPQALAPQLYQRGWVTPLSAFVHTDLDGDGDADLAIGLTRPTGADGIPSEGDVYLWRCIDGRFAGSVLAAQQPGARPPRLQEATDLTGDGRPELVVQHPHCGAHTCFNRYSVFQSEGTGFVDRFTGTTDDLPSPEWTATPASPGEPARIEIVAHGIASIGAGPYRVHSRVWTWDPSLSGFGPREDLVEPARYRIHLLHDADDAFADGDLALALASYERVIRDETLLDWPSPGDRREALAGYAAFRRVLALLAGGDAPAAHGEFEARLRDAPPGAAPYAALAQTLLESVAEGSLGAGCAAVVSQAEQMLEAVVEPLAAGYANRHYTPGDLCPAG